MTIAILSASASLKPCCGGRIEKGAPIRLYDFTLHICRSHEHESGIMQLGTTSDICEDICTQLCGSLTFVCNKRASDHHAPWCPCYMKTNRWRNADLGGRPNFHWSGRHREKRDREFSSYVALTVGHLELCSRRKVKLLPLLEAR